MNFFIASTIYEKNNPAVGVFQRNNGLSEKVSRSGLGRFLGQHPFNWELIKISYNLSMFPPGPAIWKVYRPASSRAGCFLLPIWNLGPAFLRSGLWVVAEKI